MTTSEAPTDAPPFRVGIVGLSARGGWAAGAHAPALAAVDGLELHALAASSLESARAATDAHGVPHACADVRELATREDIDLVVVSVKVPHHRELLLPAIAAGKAVFCEWPLGKNLAEAKELRDAASGVPTFVGLQGRSAPVVRYLRDLVADGYVGRVLSTTLVGTGGIWGPIIYPGGEFLLDREQGATMLTIPFGHTIDSLAFVLGEFVDLVATTATRRTQVEVSGTGATVTMTAEDQVAVAGVLAGGAVAAAHFRGGRTPGTSLLWEIDGTAGTLLVTSPTGSLNQSGVVVQGSQGEQTLSELPVPAGYDEFPALAGTPAHAVAHAYARIRDDLVKGHGTAPDFAHAVTRHRLLDAIARSAAEGRRVSLG